MHRPCGSLCRAGSSLLTHRKQKLRLSEVAWCTVPPPSLHAPLQGIMACIMGSAGVALAHHSCPQLPVQSCLHNLAALLSLLPPLLSSLCKLLTSQLSAQVTKVCVTTLVSNTYHAAIHLARAVGRGDPTFQEVQVDSRPSGERCPPAGPLERSLGDLTTWSCLWLGRYHHLAMLRQGRPSCSKDWPSSSPR